MSIATDQVEHVVFRLRNELFALPADLVEQMIEMPTVTRVPNTAPSCRGVINLRGRVVPIHDLRVLLGIEPLRDEIASMNLAQRWQDHQDWVAELKASVAEGRPFKLTTDPHKCKFGLWYDSFVARDPWLAELLAEFDAPHRQLHATADVVEGHIESGRVDLAEQTIHDLEQGSLSVLRGLFANAIEAMAAHYRETAMVVRRGGELLAFSTDQVVAVEELSEFGVDAQPEIGGSHELVKSFARRTTDGEVVMMLDAGEGSPLLKV
ncbi:MAG: chemotaxis protein CheW [Armatimonadetes bacterium]|nr:chemotaxis protein CheW [Armatimonadota bacterium]